MYLLRWLSPGTFGMRASSVRRFSTITRWTPASALSAFITASKSELNGVRSGGVELGLLTRSL